MARSSLPGSRISSDCGTMGRMSSGDFGLAIMITAPPARDRAAPGGSQPFMVRFTRIVMSSRCIMDSRCWRPMPSMPVPTTREMLRSALRTTVVEASGAVVLLGISHRAGTSAG